VSGRLRPERLLPITCIAGGALLVVSQFMDIFTLNSAGPTAQALISSADQHWYTMAVLGIYAILATVGAVVLGSKPLAVSVAVAGLAALILFLLIDLPDAGKTGTLTSETVSFLTAEADPAGGFWTELLGALVLTICGGAFATLGSDELRSLRRPKSAGREKPATDSAQAPRQRRPRRRIYQR